jgi:hypothetical protein
MRGFWVEDGARTHDPRYHKLMVRLYKVLNYSNLTVD